MEDGTGSSGDQHPPPPPPPLAPHHVRAPDEGRDLLTCGQCSQAFPLAHILTFIQHKQGGCASRNQAPNISATPPSPASRVRHQQPTGAEPGPGFIELRRGTTRDRIWGDELGLSVKAEPNKSGERMEEAEEGGRLLISDSVFMFVLLFFNRPCLHLTIAPPPSRVQLINYPLPLAGRCELVTRRLIVWKG